MRTSSARQVRHDDEPDWEKTRGKKSIIDSRRKKKTKRKEKNMHVIHRLRESISGNNVRDAY